VGVKVMTHGSVKDIAADKEVILAAGAIHSPKLLMLSGVGEETTLRSLGIASSRTCPALARSARTMCSCPESCSSTKARWPDRPADSNASRQRLTYQAALRLTQTLALVLHQLRLLRRSRLASWCASRGRVHNRASAGGSPTSKGSVRLASNNFQDAAVIDGNYLGTDKICGYRARN